MYDKNICEIEIKPLYNDQKYELIIKYENEPKKIKKQGNIISIDPGINNLMTVFGPNIDNFIINGRPIKSINSFYNKKISHLQKCKDIALKNLKIKKAKKRYIDFKRLIYNKKLRSLHDKRNKVINYHFHKITKYFVDYCKLSNIKTVIMGYNKGFKQNVNMGKKNNKTFYGIPFYSLKHKLSYKLKQEGMCLLEQEESYTSKCDALACEPIEKRRHVMNINNNKIVVGKYMGHQNHRFCNLSNFVARGKRIKRGLFKSSSGSIINADLNGAINIYRKKFNLGYNKEGIDFNLKINMNKNKLKRVTKIDTRKCLTNNLQ
jgi:IS605 OrfB family transposase